MAGRTVSKHTRVYMDGYDLSGYARTVGPLSTVFDADPQAALTDEIKNGVLGQASITPTQLNGFLDNTATSGLHVIASGAGVARTMMIPIGSLAAPAAGDPVFCGIFTQKNYYQTGEMNLYVTIDFGMWEAANRINYQKAWGTLLYAKAARTSATGANTGTGIDGGGATTAGGYFVYQVFAGNGTATLSVDDAATNTNPSFSALSGATSGSIDCSTVKYGVVPLAVTATVRQYLRFQIAFGTATTVTFASAFVRG
jgi:hypothetical protein